MKIVFLTLGLAVFVLIPVIVLRKLRWLRILVAFALLANQVLLLGYMSSLGRPVIAGVIRSDGPVREVAEALAALSDAQWPAVLALLISGVGLFLLAVFHRNSMSPAK